MRATDGVQPASTPVSNVNVANGLTVLRIVLVPVFLAALFAEGGHSNTWRWIAFAIFAAAMFTDRVDGQIARRYGLITDFGKLMDPIADKALTGAAFVGLSVLGDLPWWVTLIVLAREFGITAFRFAVIRDGVIPASRGGKLKTLLQTVAIGLYLMPLPAWMDVPSQVVMGAAVIVTVATGVDYLLSWWRGRR
ncbi:CDP-diacylglycerol--glycerol-3-phosphate 3-phosphatidyltransferase [Tsukamurella ocularis]|uniref:CDP-diacylglycerol--glycerol-3-phosphate 3-phosphatidyltransferase n=1 Tax=Tsukamurella ocularis TaxID=1970234 RepID=UPI002168835F|nr:CDP-diacylglycerol--glycerol-3-phosphate 3-phosphatidyltransferase [Tsukamurella ocularis]MCS3780159.1 CDP-diacylglycerol--glycerol-3-phosphate 3-phosphatidyltransferase [Tsukamurella ocularis]MCS3786287.1 CDP-diacylglycerol--glycerol-3-phosphate 3-phosphatidyltransferase [Tsukamurella ocularis]MCS3849651.1 CDP-diacylglycerol--glycerol-3-phosphate 3-phosphatidyltransferase [Tsukamurella ocularis]